jgi:hypothetical protein
MKTVPAARTSAARNQGSIPNPGFDGGAAVEIAGLASAETSGDSRGGAAALVAGKARSDEAGCGGVIDAG